MHPDLSPEAAEAALQASLRLDRMDVYEEIAEFWEKERLDLIRRRFAEDYREAVGVPPERRHEFREALQRIEAGGGMPVADLIAILNQPKGSS